MELEVRALAELWVEMAGIKKMVKHTRTITASPLAAETHKVLQRYADRLGRGPLHFPSSPLGLSNVWLEKPNPPSFFPIFMKLSLFPPFPLNILYIILLHTKLVYPESLYIGIFF